MPTHTSDNDGVFSRHPLVLYGQGCKVIWKMEDFKRDDIFTAGHIVPLSFAGLFVCEIYIYYYFQPLTFTMCDDAEVLARGCGHLYFASRDVLGWHLGNRGGLK